MGEIHAIDRMSPEEYKTFEGIILTVITCLSPFFLLVGAIILAYYYNTSAVCTGVLLWPMVAIALFLIVIIASAFICACLDKMWIVFLCCIGIFVAAVALLAFLIFGYIAAGGIHLGGVKVVHEYKLTDYRGWLRARVADEHHWSKISACLRHKHACDPMRQLVRDPETGTFVPKKSWAKDHQLGEGPMPIESGCCKPPSSCGFTYENGTWIPTPGVPAVETDVDCSRWSNEKQTLCFQCDSCRAGVLDETKRGWTMASIFPIILLIMYSYLFYKVVKSLED